MNKDSLFSLAFFLLVVFQIIFIAHTNSKYFEKYFIPVIIIVLILTAYYYFRYLKSKIESFRKPNNISSFDEYRRDIENGKNQVDKLLDCEQYKQYAKEKEAYIKNRLQNQENENQNVQFIKQLQQRQNQIFDQ